MKATFGHQTRAPTELINDNTVTLSQSETWLGKILANDICLAKLTIFFPCQTFMLQYSMYIYESKTDHFT